MRMCTARKGVKDLPILPHGMPAVFLADWRYRGNMVCLLLLKMFEELNSDTFS